MTCNKALPTKIGGLSKPLWLGYIFQLYLDHNLIGVEGASCSHYFKLVEYLISILVSERHVTTLTTLKFELKMVAVMGGAN